VWRVLLGNLRSDLEERTETYGASWAIAVEEKMNIDPPARANCKDFRIAFLRRFFVTHRQIELRREFIALLVGARRSGRLRRVPAADERTMQEFPLSDGYLI
jgi:hypothetical protein